MFMSDFGNGFYISNVQSRITNRLAKQKFSFGGNCICKVLGIIGINKFNLYSKLR